MLRPAPLPTLLALSLLAPLGVARGELIVVEFNSTITYTQGLPVAGLSPSIGAPVSGFFTYDLSAPDSAPGDPSFGQYSTGQLEVIIDGHRITCDLGSVYVYDINAPNDLFGFSAGTPLGAAPLVVDGVTLTNSYIALNFTESTGTVLTSDALPGVAALTALAVDQFNLVQTDTNGVLLYDNVTITSVRGGDLAISSVVDVANDQGRQVRLTWSRSTFDTPLSPHPITQYAIFRRVDPLPKLPPGDWDFVRTVPAFGEARYSTVVPTLCDSTAAGVCISAFLVRAMTASPTVFFDSQVATGYSIDNLAPAIPLHLTSAPSGLLAWDESPEVDFDYYAIFGSTDSQLDAGDKVLGYTTTPGFDASGAGFAYFHVTATDFAGNEGAAATVANASVVAAPDQLPNQFALRAIWPNPGRGLTNIAYELPQAGQVDAAVFDLMGRRVRVLGNSERSAGRNLLAWDGRDDGGRSVASGIYFVRIRFGESQLAGRVLRKSDR
jgi:hypothetical protein